MKVGYLGIQKENSMIRDQLIDAAARVIDSGQYILSDEVAAFEKELSHFLGVNHAISLNSGTDALILSLASLDLEAGSEVLTVSNSFFATVNSIFLTGLQPTFVDVGGDMNMDVAKLEAAITPKTKVIMPVHLTGRPCNMSEICRLAEKYNLYIVEDSAQAIGARWDGRSVGSFGLGAFSLHPLKNLSALGDGGFVTTNDSNLADCLRKLRNHGLESRDKLVFAGYNSHLDEIQASFLRVKLGLLHKATEARRKNARIYHQNLEGLIGSGLIYLPQDSGESYSVYHTFVIRAESRDQLQEYLLKNGIETKIHYKMPFHLQENFFDPSCMLPNTTLFKDQILSLPVHQHLQERELEYVCDKIKSFYG